MQRLRIGIVCYPSVGGSGIVATQLGSELAARGHEVHFISYERPFRLVRRQKNVFFHQVEVNGYDVFKYPDYTLPLAVRIAEVHKYHRLHLVHVHYAVPHATAALLARQIVQQRLGRSFSIVTTLHGTDTTLVGRDQNLLPIIRYSLEKSDGVTTVSESLKRDTRTVFKTRKPIEVIYNFYTPQQPRHMRAVMRRKLGVRPDEFLAIHMSNLRPVKRIPDLLHAVSRVARHQPIRLLILAGGSFVPYQPLVKRLGLQNRIIVKQHVIAIEDYLIAADCGIYPSEHESFGMGILESMSYGLPVLASRTGGIPEVLINKKTGFLYPVGDRAGFAQGLALLIQNEALRRTMGHTARERAQTHFSADRIVGHYLAYYQKVLRSDTT